MLERNFTKNKKYAFEIRYFNLLNFDFDFHFIHNF